MKLRYDPYQVFRNSKTPAGLYARQKWLGEADTPRWKINFKETIAVLLADQLHDGSWRHSTVETIQRLFGLHLTVRSSTAQIDAALTWLLNKIALQERGIYVGVDDLDAVTGLEGLPFIKSRSDMFLTGAALFLSSIFGHQSDPDVLTLYQWLSAEGIKSKGRWFDEASTHNALRAMVVHPVFAEDKATALAVEYLADLQTDTGTWNHNLPFYQTLNALAHLEFSQAQKQLEKAFLLVFENQNSDGTWSHDEPEWNTFLTIHALKNKGLL
ncbi:MAG: hypothetical protein PVF29_14840 [Desulfobacterales bacterium]|jgi:hypothetical protein